MVDLPRLLVPLVTPFTDDSSSVSEVRLARLVRHLTNQGIEGFVLCSDVGEFTAMSFGERKSIVELVARDSPGTTMVVNVSSLSTAASLDLTQHAKRHGARAAVLMPPYYGDLSKAEVIGHAQTIARHGSITLIAVNGSAGAGHWEASEEIPNIISGRSLAELGHLELAVGNTSMTHEFAAGGSLCTPLALIFPDLVHGGAPPGLGLLRSLMATAGVAKVAKALLERMSLEVGPVRGPQRTLAPEYLAQLADVLG